MKIIIPFWQLIGVQSTNKNIVGPSVDGPVGDGCVICLLVEVRRGPDAVEDCLSQHVRGGKVLAAVEQAACYVRFGLGDRECGLETFLFADVRGHHIVVSMVEFAKVWPPLHEVSPRSPRVSCFRYYPKVCSCIWRDKTINIAVQDVFLLQT